MRAGPESARGGNRTPDVAHGLGERPECQGRLDSFRPQATEHSQGARRIPGKHGLSKLKDIEACAVGNALEHGLCIRTAPWRQQSELLELLAGREQVALGAFRQQLERLVADFELHPAGSGAQPAHEAIGLHGPHLHPAAAALERAHPVGRLRIAVQPRRENQEQGVGVLTREQIRERGVAAGAGFTGRQSNLYQASGSKERQRAGGRAHLVPVRAALHEVHVPLAESGRPGLGANGIGGLARQQRIVPRDQVGGSQRLLQVCQQGRGNFEVPHWDSASQKKVRDALLVLGSTLTDFKRAFGNKDQVDPIRRLIGAAMGWGGNPEKDAVYLNVTPDQNDGVTAYEMLVREVPVDGFWSVSVYNSEGFFEPNPFDVYTLNNLTAKMSPDGSIGIQFGGCAGATKNCLPIMKGWNYTVRLYRPRAEILNGKWNFPTAQPMGTQTLKAA